MNYRIFFAAVIVLVVAFAVWGLSQNLKTDSAVTSLPGTPLPENAEFEGELAIFHAGSLSVPFAEISKLFMEKNPKVKILTEAAGSRDTARKVSDLGQEGGVLGSADSETIYELLIPEHASWCIEFARNEMVIAYTEKSISGETINSENWHEVLFQPGVRFGRADPDRDPCGYRTLMVFQLAEKHYAAPGLAEKLETKDGKKYNRPKETDLLALLESGEIDYLFIYLSVAVQHNLKYIKLPAEINLGNPSLAAAYENASVKVKGASPGETTVIIGAPIVYGVTIPTNAPNRAAAETWIELLLSAEGAAILEKCGQPPIVPALSLELEKLPMSLQKYCAKESESK